MIESIKDCSEQPKERRLECLQSSLTSPRAQFSAHYGHIKDKALDYMKEDPAKIVVGCAGFVLILSNAEILPLGVGAIAFLTAIKEVLGKNKEE